MLSSFHKKIKGVLKEFQRQHYKNSSSKVEQARKDLESILTLCFKSPGDANPGAMEKHTLCSLVN